MLRSSLYSPLTLTDEAEVSVKLNLLAGHNLGVGDIVVELHLHGHPLDETSCQWSSSPAAGPHPHWPETGAGGQVVLTVRRPQLAVLEVKVCSKIGANNGLSENCRMSFMKQHKSIEKQLNLVQKSLYI